MGINNSPESGREAINSKELAREKAVDLRLDALESRVESGEKVAETSPATDKEEAPEAALAELDKTMKPVAGTATEYAEISLAEGNQKMEESIAAQFGPSSFATFAGI